jgi:hypothetical protein
MTVGIYALVDPRSNVAMYVGSSIDLELRFRKQHCSTDRQAGGEKKLAWVMELRQLGLVPRLQIVEECPLRLLRERERYWIETFVLLGQAVFNRNGRHPVANNTYYRLRQENASLKKEVTRLRRELGRLTRAA